MWMVFGVFCVELHERSFNYREKSPIVLFGYCKTIFSRFVFFIHNSIEITVSHAERIPPNKPVMLVCAPHANQFVDAMVLSTHLQQNPFFIGAASSFRKYKIVGLLMRWMHSIIPVERPQDRKQDIRGKGVIQGDTVKVRKVTHHVYNRDLELSLQRRRQKEVRYWYERNGCVDCRSVECAIE